MPILKIHSHHLLLLNHQHPQPSQTTTNQPTHAHAIFLLGSDLDTADPTKLFLCLQYLRFRFPDYFITTILGKWAQGDPTGCATTCGVGAGRSGTPGAVVCSTDNCDADAKPARKQCPKTVDCGTFDTGDADREQTLKPPPCLALSLLITLSANTCAHDSSPLLPS